MTGDNGEVAVLRGSHADVVESPDLEGRIEIDATDAEPTVRVPSHVGVEYGDEDELTTDGGAVVDETRIVQEGWSPSTFEADAAMWGGGLLLIAGGAGLSQPEGSVAATMAIVAVLGGIGLLYLGHKAAAGGAA